MTTRCLLCGHDEARHRNLLSQCDCGCRATKFGNTPHGVSRVEYDQLLDAIKHAAAVVAQARADADAFAGSQPSGAASRVARTALTRVADELDAALNQASALATARSYSDKTPVVRKVYDAIDGTEADEVAEPPHRMAAG